MGLAPQSPCLARPFILSISCDSQYRGQLLLYVPWTVLSLIISVDRLTSPVREFTPSQMTIMTYQSSENNRVRVHKVRYDSINSIGSASRLDLNDILY
jgi:hypothetical protein